MKRIATQLRRLADRLDPPKPIVTENNFTVLWPKGTTFYEASTEGKVTYR